MKRLVQESCQARTSSMPICFKTDLWDTLFHRVPLLSICCFWCLDLEFERVRASRFEFVIHRPLWNVNMLIRYARCCSHYDDFRYRHKCLVDRLLSQGYKALRLEKSFKKFYGRYQDLIEKYRRSVNAMVSDSFPGQFLFNM